MPRKTAASLRSRRPRTQDQGLGRSGAAPHQPELLFISDLHRKVVSDSLTALRLQGGVNLALRFDLGEQHFDQPHAVSDSVRNLLPKARLDTDEFREAVHKQTPAGMRICGPNTAGLAEYAPKDRKERRAGAIPRRTDSGASAA
jgi:hypothetical protein